MAYNPYYSAENAREHMSRQKRSGLSISEYCRRNSIRPSTFYGWNKRLKKKTSTRVKQTAPFSFVEVPVQPVCTNSARGVRITRTEIDLHSDSVQAVCDVIKEVCLCRNDRQ
jgi:hypothetical protein